MKLNALPMLVFAAAALFGAASAAHAVTYQFQQSAKGLVASPPAPSVPAAPAHVYATWDAAKTSASYTIGSDKLTLTYTGATVGAARANVTINAGKWYWEVSRAAGSNIQGIGILSSTYDTVNGACAGCYAGQTQFKVAYQASYMWSQPDITAVPMPQSSGDVLGFALDMTTGRLSVYNNCSSTPYLVWSGMNGTTWAPIVSTGGGSKGQVVTANFGASAFACQPPAGFNAGVWQE